MQGKLYLNWFKMHWCWLQLFYTERGQTITWTNDDWVLRCAHDARIVLFMRPANERRRYIVTSSLIDWARTQNEPCLYVPLGFPVLTHWDWVTHICVTKLTIIWTSAGMLLIGPLGTNFNEISIEIHILWFKKIYWKMLSGKWRPFVSALMC